VVYGTAGNIAVMEAVGKNEGHTTLSTDHPAGISIHTILNCDPGGRIPLIPSGNPGKATDSDVINDEHNIVPGGHVVRFTPGEPCAPVGPVGPTIELGPHDSGV
jgi:hypothetical protein